MNFCHVLYGLTISSNIPLPGVSIRSTIERPDVRIRLKEWKPEFQPSRPNSPNNCLYISPDNDEGGQPALRVEMLADGLHFVFFYSDGARFAVSRNGSEVWADWPENYTLEDACTYLVGPVIAFALRLRGVTCLHGSAVAVDGRAIVLFGLAGAGKSTTAAAFALSGYPVLTDDVAVLDDHRGQFSVQPGYPRINLWPDSVQTLFRSKDVLPAITTTWDKRYMMLDQDGRRFQPKALPLGAIYILSEREPDLAAPAVEDLAGCEAFMTLVGNTYVNYLLDDDMREREFDVLSRILAGVPVRCVRPTADPSKVFALCEIIASDARRLAARNSTNTIFAPN